MALNISTIATNIAALEVSGVTIKDITGIKDKFTKRDCPVVYPNPDGFVSDFNVVRDSFGDPSQAKKTVTYTLTYRFLQAPLGSGRINFAVYSDFITKAYAFIDAIIANDDISGAVDLEISDALNFGPVADPSGNTFHGCDIALNVKEFVN